MRLEVLIARLYIEASGKKCEGRFASGTTRGLALMALEAPLDLPLQVSGGTSHELRQIRFVGGMEGAPWVDPTLILDLPIEGGETDDRAGPA